MNNDSYNKYRALIVEDDPELAECYANLLKNADGVEIVFSGLDALKKLKSPGDIDIVLLDYKLPDISGLEVLQEMKHAFPLPIIFITAYGNEDIAVKALKYGAIDYVKKPFINCLIIKWT